MTASASSAARDSRTGGGEPRNRSMTCAEVGDVISCSRSSCRCSARPVGGSRSSSSHTSSSRSDGMSRIRAASTTLTGVAAAKSTATRCPASAESAASLGCSSTRVELSLARRRVRTGSTLVDTHTHSSQQRPPEYKDYDNQCSGTGQSPPFERSGIEKNLYVVLAWRQGYGSKQDVRAQQRHVDTVHARPPARVPRIPLQQVPGLRQLDMGAPCFE